MDQTRDCWMWPKPKLHLASSCGDSWEELAFAEDTAGALGGCVWPPRSYTCNFCRKDFRSAQALGGHMNVHRRDRARLKQSPPSDDGDVGVPHGSNRALTTSVSLDNNNVTFLYNNSDDRGILGSDLGSERNNNNSIEKKKKKDYSRSLEDLKIKNINCEENDERVIILESRCVDDLSDGSCRKRRRIDDSNLFGYDPKRCLVDRFIHHRPQPEGNGIQTIPSSIEELDLELRLGSPPKVN